MSCKINIIEKKKKKDHAQFVNDASIIFIDKTDPTEPLKREQYWRHTLKTLVPYGLKVSESG